MTDLGISVTVRKKWYFPLVVWWAKVCCIFDDSDEHVHNAAKRVIEQAMDIRVNGESVPMGRRGR